MGLWAKSLLIFNSIRENGKQSLRELARRTGVSKSSVHRHLQAIDRLEVTMHTAFGNPSATSQLSKALLTVFSNRVENQQTFGPQSHIVGPCSEGWLKS